jgi:hypothetical protein
MGFYIFNLKVEVNVKETLTCEIETISGRSDRSEKSSPSDSGVISTRDTYAGSMGGGTEVINGDIAAKVQGSLVKVSEVCR